MTPTTPFLLHGSAQRIATPNLAASRAIELGTATIHLGPFADRLSSAAWERMADLMSAYPVEAYGLLEHLLEAQLASDFAYLPFDQVRPSISAALACDDHGIRERGERMIHRLGEAGHREFGQLIRQPDVEEPPSAAS